MMKGLRTFLYELKYAFLQMKRHIMLCFSAISAIGITLLLIGSILIIGLHVNYFSNDVQKDLSIHVILNEDIDDETEEEGMVGNEAEIAAGGGTETGGGGAVRREAIGGGGTAMEGGRARPSEE